MGPPKIIYVYVLFSIAMFITERYLQSSYTLWSYPLILPQLLFCCTTAVDEIIHQEQVIYIGSPQRRKKHTFSHWKLVSLACEMTRGFLWGAVNAYKWRTCGGSQWLYLIFYSIYNLRLGYSPYNYGYIYIHKKYPGHTLSLWLCHGLE